MYPVIESQKRSWDAGGRIWSIEILGLPMKVGRLGKSKKGKDIHLRFNDLKISYLDTTGGEIRDLKFDVDWAFAFSSLSSTSHATTKATSHTASMLIIPFH